MPETRRTKASASWSTCCASVFFDIRVVPAGEILASCRGHRDDVGDLVICPLVVKSASNVGDLRLDSPTLGELSEPGSLR